MQMDDARFNMSMRKFLKEVGVTSQREIERVVRQMGGKNQRNLPVKMTLTAEGTDLCHIVESVIELDANPAADTQAEDKPGPAIVRRRGNDSK